MSLKRALTKTAVREKGGARASARLDFQKDWALWEMFRRHYNKEEYLFFFDFHDDVVIADSEDSPTRLEFFQVKTDAKKQWTLAALLRVKALSKKKKNKQSILGKLFSNKIKFPTHITSLNLVSNQAFDITLKSTDKKSTDFNRICLKDTSQDAQDKVDAALKKEHKLSSNPSAHHLMHLYVTDLSLNDSSTHAKGKIGEILEREHPGKKFPIGVIYKTIFDEVRIKSNSDKDASSFSELLLLKSLGKRFIEKVLQRSGVGTDYEKLWLTVLQTLSNENYTAMEIATLSKAWRTYEIHKMDPTNDVIKQLTEIISKYIDQIEAKHSKGESSTLREILKNGIETVRETITKLPYGNDLISAALLMRIYE
ncbi:MAG: DUF4297 domain-containing protein [Oligoflexia bacterium]|nr:DUF4297 domain-containing protein [Oligoflexia bacterium]